MRIAITGACGYIGSVLTPKLLRTGESIDLLDIQDPVPGIASMLDGKKNRFLKVDVSNFTQMKKLAPEYDAIIHLAALVGYPACNKSPRLAVRRNTLTTKALASFCKKDAIFALASTVSNYGATAPLVTEETPIHPPSIYGRTKMRAEEIVQTLPNHVIFRIAGAFGCSPKMRHDNIVHDFVRQAVSGQTLSIYENHFIRQFVHVEDIANAFIFAIQHPDKMCGEIFNLGHPGIEITKGDLIKKIQQYHPTKYIFENSGQDPEMRNYRISFDKLVQTGFSPKYTLDVGLQHIVAHYASGPQHPLSALLDPRPARYAA